MVSGQAFVMPDMPAGGYCIIDIVGVFVHVSKNETSGPTLFSVRPPYSGLTLPHDTYSRPPLQPKPSAGFRKMSVNTYESTCCASHEILTSWSAQHSACHEICASRSTKSSTAPASKSALQGRKDSHHEGLPRRFAPRAPLQTTSRCRLLKTNHMFKSHNSPRLPRKPRSPPCPKHCTCHEIFTST